MSEKSLTTCIELSIIIVSYNVRQLLLDCIKSVIDTCGGINYEIIVVDNTSSDGSVDSVRESFPQVCVIANKDNVGFARANNQGYEVSRGKFILLLNPDTIVKPGAIQSVLDFLKNTPDAGLAGCRLLNPDGSLQKSIKRFPSIREHIGGIFFVDKLPHFNAIHCRASPFAIDYCSGAFMMVRKEVLGRMPILNPEYFMYSEEKDLSLRLKRKGWKTYFVPFGEVIHFGGQSTRLMPEKMYLQLQKSQLQFFSLSYKGAYKWTLIFTWWLVLSASFIASIPFALTDRGRYRMRLMMIAACNYPLMVLSNVLANPSTSIIATDKSSSGQNTVKNLFAVGKEFLSLSEMTIRMSGDTTNRKMYDYFTKPHPRYKIIQNKRWGVELLQLPGSMNEYLSGKHKEYIRRMRNKAIRHGFHFVTADPMNHLTDMLAINLSAPVRQGRPMAPDYLHAEGIRRYFMGKERIYCVFDQGGAMKAYAYVPVIGEVCILDRILGHSEDLDKGLMYLLVSEIIREMIALKNSNGEPKWMEYDTYFGGSQGIRYFKEKLGFMPYKVKWIWSDSGKGGLPR